MRPWLSLFCLIALAAGLNCSGGLISGHREDPSASVGPVLPEQGAGPGPAEPIEAVQQLVPEQIVAEGTARFAAFEMNQVAGDGNALLGYAGLGNAPFVDDPVDIVARSRTFTCLGLQRRAGSLQDRVGLRRCSDPGAQKFVFRADGHVEVQTLAVTAGQTGTLCLTAANDGAVDVAVCDSSPLQRWGAAGHLLHNTAKNACLGRHDGSRNGASVALMDCRLDDAAQSWAYGDIGRIRAQAAAANPNFPESTVGRANPAKYVLVGFAAGSSSVELGRDVSLALRQGLDQCVAPALRPGPVELARCEVAPQLVFQPDGHIETAQQPTAGTPLCLASALSTDDPRNLLVLAECADDARQRWSVAGHNLQNQASKACLAYEVANYLGARPAMRPCDGTDVSQSWAFAELPQLRRQATADQRAYTVEQLCAVQVTVFPPPGKTQNSPGS